MYDFTFICHVVTGCEESDQCCRARGAVVSLVFDRELCVCRAGKEGGGQFGSGGRW